MAQVGAAERTADITVALRIKWPRILKILTTLDVYPAEGGEEHTVACITGGHDAVEHVVAGVNTLYQVLRRTDPHDVARLLLRKVRCAEAHYVQHPLLFLPNRYPAK